MWGKATSRTPVANGNRNDLRLERKWEFCIMEKMKREVSTVYLHRGAPLRLPSGRLTLTRSVAAKSPRGLPSSA